MGGKYNCSADQWRNEVGGKGGHLPPGAALWGRQIGAKFCAKFGAKFSVNVSSAQQFLVAHTYKLCHTAFICMKYKR